MFAIRHSELNTNDIKISTDDNGLPKIENDVLKLDLNSHPAEFTVENEQMPNVVTLDKSMYTIDVAIDKSQSNCYDLSVMLERRTLLTYTCVDVGGRFILLDNINGGSVNATGGTLVIAKRGGHGFAAFNNSGAIEISSEAALAIFDYDFIVYRDVENANPSGTIAAEITVENVPNRVADGLNVTVTGSVSDGDVKDVAIDIPEIPDIPAAA